jgi:hypothetical protein
MKMLTGFQGEAGRNPAEVADPTKFDAKRKISDVTAFSYGQHECVAKDMALAFVVGLVKLTADLKQLRPAPGAMGLVKTIRVGSEKAYLNDSWSYLGFDASSKFTLFSLCINGHPSDFVDSMETPFRWSWKGQFHR